MCSSCTLLFNSKNGGEHLGSCLWLCNDDKTLLHAVKRETRPKGISLVVNEVVSVLLAS